jgi:hypothetical protein
MDQATINIFWSSACSSVRSNAQLSARLSRPEFAQLTLNVVERFCSQAPPTTKEELDFRGLQRTALPNIFGSIDHCETMARHTPAATQELYDLATEISEQPLPTTKEECQQITNNRLANSGRAQLICNKY